MVSDFKSFLDSDGGQARGGRRRGMGLSLSEGCALHLHKELNKDERMSDWNLRPLSGAQLHYAALDAHCLLGILDDILERIGEKESERTGAGAMYRNNALSDAVSAVPDTMLQSDTGRYRSWREDWRNKYIDE